MFKANLKGTSSSPGVLDFTLSVPEVFPFSSPALKKDDKLLIGLAET